MTKMKRKLSVFFSALLLFFTSCAQQEEQDTIQKAEEPIEEFNIEWTRIANGVFLCETIAPELSTINDSKLTIIKLIPDSVDFQLMMASEHIKDSSFTAKEWADSFQLNLVVNAGMYDLAHQMNSKGFLKSRNHINQAEMQANYNAMISFEPKDTLLPGFDILDLKCENWDSRKNDYYCYAQGLRMIDCDGLPMSWNKKKQSCSMLVTVLDEEKNVYFIFCRSPYSQNQMISFMQQFPFKLTNAIYMEGGPQTSIYMNYRGQELIKIGSYVSTTWETDENNEFWPLPNVIGVRFK